MSELVERLRGLRDQLLAVGEREIAARLDSIAAELARPRAANKAQAAERERCAQIAEHASCSSDKGYAYEWRVYRRSRGHRRRDTGRPAMSDDADAVIEAMILAVSNLIAESQGGFSSEQVVQTVLRAGEAMGWKLTSQHASARMIASGLDKQLPDGSHSLLVVWRAMHAAAPALGGDDASATVPECSE